MSEQKNKGKPPSPIIWLVLSVMAFLTVPALCGLVLVLIRQDMQQALIDDYNSTPGPWSECSFDFADKSGRVTLMRQALPGFIHTEYGLQVRVQFANGETAEVSGYTENRRTEVYTEKAVFQDGRRVPILRVESGISTYRIDLIALEELSFREIPGQTDTVYLGYFDGIDNFFPNVSSVIPVVNGCGVVSTPPSPDQ